MKMYHQVIYFVSFPLQLDSGLLTKFLVNERQVEVSQS